MLAEEFEPAPLSNAQAVRDITEIIERNRNPHECRPAAQVAKLLEDLGAERRDESDGNATIEEYTLLTSDGMVTLTYGCTPDLLGMRRGYTLDSYRHEPDRRKQWEF